MYNKYKGQMTPFIIIISWDVFLYVIRKLGTLGQGLSCQMLKEYLQDDTSLSGVRKVLIFLQQQTHPLHISLVRSLLCLSCILTLLLFLLKMHRLCSDYASLPHSAKSF